MFLIDRLEAAFDRGIRNFGRDLRRFLMIIWFDRLFLLHEGETGWKNRRGDHRRRLLTRFGRFFLVHEGKTGLRNERGDHRHRLARGSGRFSLVHDGRNARENSRGDHGCRLFSRIFLNSLCPAVSAQGDKHLTHIRVILGKERGVILENAV